MEAVRKREFHVTFKTNHPVIGKNKNVQIYTKKTTIRLQIQDIHPWEVSGVRDTKGKVLVFNNIWLLSMATCNICVIDKSLKDLKKNPHPWNPSTKLRFTVYIKYMKMTKHRTLNF